MNTNKIVILPDIGDALTFEQKDIMSVVVDQASNIVMDELPIGTVEAVVKYSSPDSYYFADSEGRALFCWERPVDDPYHPTVLPDLIRPVSTESESKCPLLSLPVDTQMNVYSGTQLIGKFYVTEVTRTAPKQYRIRAQDVFGILDKMPFYGHNNTTKTRQERLTLAGLVQKVILTDGFPSSDTDHTAVVELYNDISIYSGADAVTPSICVPAGTKREVLHKLLMSYGLFPAWDGERYVISAPGEYYTTDINDAHIYLGGSMTYPEKVSAVTVSYSSFDSTETVESVSVPGPYNAGIYTLPEGHDGKFIYRALAQVRAASGQLEYVYLDSTPEYYRIDSNGPYYSLTLGLLSRYTTALTVTDNAIVNGKELTVSDTGCLESSNASTLAGNILRYNTERVEVNLDIVVPPDPIPDIVTGRDINITTPLNERKSCYLQSMKLTLSGKNKAAAVFISSLRVSSFFFKSSALLTGSGTYSIPTEAISRGRLLAYVIGGGSGGSSGLAGEKGGSCGVDFGVASGGAGGKYGDPGSGGKILALEYIGDDIPDNVYYSCGTGGTGGSACSSTSVSNKGSAGTQTVFWDRTSDEGKSLDGGITDPTTGITYGRMHHPVSKVNATSGGAGGSSWMSDGSRYVDYGKWVLLYNDPGTGDDYTWVGGSYGPDEPDIAAPGGGGGAAYMRDGYAAQKSTKSSSGYNLGAGGKGASAAAQYSIDYLRENSQQQSSGDGGYTYGDGGLAGHGGGGGGCSSTGLRTGITILNNPEGGAGGKGGAGGAGGSGCVLLVW